MLCSTDQYATYSSGFKQRRAAQLPPPPRSFFVDCDSALPKSRILKITRYENVSLVFRYKLHVLKKSVVPL